ncbi:MAG: flippase activity-associated protein Agl23 [Solirubrobacteraceae bacterium]
MRRRPSREVIAYAVLVAVALGMRLYDLGSRPFHHDESQDAYFSWILFTEGDYAYNPLLHGPLRFYLTATMYALFGDSDFTARLAPALMGTSMVAMPYFLRRQLGRVAAFTAAVLLAIGPSYLYFSRFAREDIYIAAITLAMLVVAFRFFERPRRHQPALFGALLALSFATKESTFITAFVAGTFFLAVLATRHRGLLLGPVRAVGREAWGWALAAFVGVYTVLFTTFLTHPGGLDGIYTGLEYWLGQHEVGRGGEPWYFYGLLLFGVEWPVLVLGAAGAVVALRRPTLLRVFLVWAFVVSLVVYSWAGEKFAWLVLHPLLPLLLLAGVGVQAIWEARRHVAGKVGLAVVALAFAYAGYGSFLVNAVHRADPRELLVSTQSSEEVARVADEVVALRPSSVTVDASEGATFPWAWYFRDLEVEYPELATRGSVPDSDVLILTEAARDRLAPELGGYRGREFPFRVWWVRDGSEMTPASWWRWLTKREPWNDTGGMPEWLYVRR